MWSYQLELVFMHVVLREFESKHHVVTFVNL